LRFDNGVFIICASLQAAKKCCRSRSTLTPDTGPPPMTLLLLSSVLPAFSPQARLTALGNSARVVTLAARPGAMPD
jgi:hypothetical protein